LIEDFICDERVEGKDETKRTKAAVNEKGDIILHRIASHCIALLDRRALLLVKGKHISLKQSPNYSSSSFFFFSSSSSSSSSSSVLQLSPPPPLSLGFGFVPLSSSFSSFPAFR